MSCWIYFTLLLALTTAELSRLPLFVDDVADGNDETKLWAVLVAGSNGWSNYRHQADICHAYQILHLHGIPDERIIVMMYDDIAHNFMNPYPGKIFNRPNGTDRYEGVPKDYIKRDVTPKNFLKVLSGDKEAMRNVGSGKVLESGPNDHVFVYFADHGANGLVAFPDAELYARDLLRTLHEMHQRQTFKQLVFYMEACESGSMFKNLLPSDINVYAMTAANERESSFGTYCVNKMHLPCMGDLFSVVWMQDSDKLYASESRYRRCELQEQIQVETLEHQFEVTKRLTNLSHVQRFGDLSIMTEKVADFQGHRRALRRHDEPYQIPNHSVPSREISMYYAFQRFVNAPRTEKRQRYLELTEMAKKRKIVDKTVEAIVHVLVRNAEKRKRILSSYPRDLAAVLHCHETVTKSFSKHCFKLAKNPYALGYVKVMGNLCEQGIRRHRIIQTIKAVCKEREHFSGYAE